MNLKITAVWEATDIMKACFEELKAKNIDASIEDLKLIVINKTGAEIDVSPDKVKIVFNKS